MPKVDIGIATYGMVAQEWWSDVMVLLLQEQASGLELGKIHAISSALPDHNKNHTVDDRRGVAPPEDKGRNERTDANKSTIVGARLNGQAHKGGFLHGDADWLFFMDDDTVPPKGVISHLLSLGREFVGGLYFLAKPPHNPIAYFRHDDGTYMALWNYPHGALIEVDSIGMGCTLIHRSVYERILDGYEVFQRPNGSLMPVLRENVRGLVKSSERVKTEVINGVLHMPVTRPPEEDGRPFPFYSMEYGRTEDHHFAELCAGIGIKPYLDTTVICDHYKLKAVNRAAHKLMVEQMAVDYGDPTVNQLAGQPAGDGRE